ncbi:peptidoglycan editing factor PgeF [Desulfobulbus elongatus]|uniref:peptidoglycan editing factor PgeF n=1 Tax=Desulfobulbus elongatus TaxID=53332 RepID=UPI000481966B|nr:peptidoglycan editing factor PgeF [Desulfobulbus elongatus]
MRLHQSPLPHYTSLLLPVPHGMFTCAGGTSEPPFASLNLSHSVGDQAERVHANRARALAALGLRHLVSVRQVHGDRILRVDDRKYFQEEPEGYDALITSLPDTGVLIQQADCQAVLLAAPAAGIVAAIHCGWRGSVLDLIGKTIHCLHAEYGIAPASLRAAISPSLGPCCAEFIHYRKELPAWMHAFQVRPHHFDFWSISRRQLLDAGVLPEHIDVAGLCTRCNPQFFSYRRARTATGGVTGRNGSFIGLPPTV